MENEDFTQYPTAQTATNRTDLVPGAETIANQEFDADEEAVRALQMLEQRRKQRKQQKIIIAVAAVCAIAVIAAIVGFLISQNQASGEEGPQVETDFVVRDDYSVPVEGQGSLKAVSSTSVTPEVEGKVVEVFVEEGQEVKEGDPLYRVESADIEKEIEEEAAKVRDAERGVAQAQANVDKAQSTYNKANKAYKAAKSRADAAEKKYQEEVAKAEAAKAQAEKKGQAAYDKEYNKAYKDALADITSDMSKEEKERKKKDAKRDAERNAKEKYDEAYNKVDIPSVSPYDADAYAEKLETAEADRDSAQEDLDAAREEVSTAQDEVVSAQESYAEVEKEREKCTITAPQSGTLVSFKAKVGQQSGSSGDDGAESIARIEDLGKMKMNIAVAESVITKVEEGQRVEVSPTAFPDMTLTGKVSQVASSAEGADDMGGFEGSTAEFGVEIVIDEPDERLKPGMSAKVTIHTQEMKNVLMVPVTAVTEEDDGSYVEVVTNADPLETEMKKVQITTQDDEWAIIKDGVSEGDEIVISRIDFSADTDEDMGGEEFDEMVDDSELFEAEGEGEDLEKEAEL